MQTLAQVALGGAIGAVARFLVVSGATRFLGAHFPIGTLLVNVIGSLAMGVLAAFLLGPKGTAPIAPFLLTGLLGGFTTFSAFAYENQVFFKEGDFTNFLIYTLGSISLGLVAVFLGLFISKNF